MDLNGLDRIKRVLLNDKITSYDGFKELLKSDIKNAISSYMIVKSINFDIDIKEDNNYVVTIIVESKDIVSPSCAK